MFDYGGEGSPDSVEARAYPLEQGKQWLPGADGTRLMRPKEGRSVLATEDLRDRRAGDRMAILAELNSGEYVVEVLIRVPEGDASYYFHATVEGNAGKRFATPMAMGWRRLNPRLHPLEVHLSCTTVIKLCAEDQPEESCTLNL